MTHLGSTSGRADVKLYLSSFRLGDQSERLLELAAGSRRVALIPNALDAMATTTRTAVIARGMDDLRKLGFESTITDLREYFGRPASLEAHLARYGVVFVTGGNVFVLRRAMLQAGLDRYLRAAAGAPELVYAAYSAGAGVLGPTLRGFEHVDDPEVVPAGYGRGTIWDGLGLIDFVFIPHFESDHHESAAIRRVVDHCVRNHVPFRVLRNGEVFIRA